MGGFGLGSFPRWWSDIAWGFSPLGRWLGPENPLPRTLVCGSFTWPQVGTGC